MQDTFRREITIGDIIIRIYDWGAAELSIIVSETPAGYLRTISYSLASIYIKDSMSEWAKGSTMKNGSNLIILDETLLRHHIGESETLIQTYLEQQRKIKEQQ